MSDLLLTCTSMVQAPPLAITLFKTTPDRKCLVTMDRTSSLLKDLNCFGGSITGLGTSLKGTFQVGGGLEIGVVAMRRSHHSLWTSGSRIELSQ